MSPRAVLDLKVIVPLASLALAGCSTTDSMQTASLSRPAAVQASVPRPPASLTVDDATRGILMAAGLDPADPTKPKEIHQRQVAGVVQIRVRGQTYGTALARPAPGRITFVDPTAVANLLGGARGKTELAQALRGPIIDIDSRDCHFDQRSDRKVRKAFKLPKVCPAPGGAVWADLNRREMVVELRMDSRLAELVQPAPTRLANLAEPTLLNGPAAAQSAEDPDPEFMPETPRSAQTSVNLFSPEALASTQNSPYLAAAAPISLSAPVVLPPLPQGSANARAELAAIRPQETSPLSTLLGPARTTVPDQAASNPVQPASQTRTVDLTPAPPRPNQPTVALVGSPGGFRPAVYQPEAVAETDDNYSAPSKVVDNVRVIEGTYRMGPVTPKYGYR